MGMIPDRRPRDWAYKAAFQEKDLPSLQQMIKHIQLTHDVDMIEDFNSKCEEKLSGNKAILNNGIEITDVTKTGDLVVNVGLQQCIRLIQQTSTVRFRYMHVVNIEGSPPNVGDVGFTGSTASQGKLSLSTYGWMEARGMKLYFGCVTPQVSGASNQVIETELGTGTILEMAIGNGSENLPPAIMLNREAFANNPLNRTLTEDIQVYNIPWILSCVIEFCPVAD